MEDEWGRAKVNLVDKDHEKKEQQRKESEGKVSKVRDWKKTLRFNYQTRKILEKTQQSNKIKRKKRKFEQG